MQFITKILSFSGKVFFSAIVFLMLLVTNSFSQQRIISTDGKPFAFSGMVGHTPDQKPVMVTDISRDQLLSDCMFYAGDSLNGFNFGEKCRAAEKDGNHMYSEFLHFMFREETNFIKEKYHIAKLPFEIAKEKMKQKAKVGSLELKEQGMNQKSGTPHVLGSCNNLDLSTGDFTGWLGGSGDNTNSNGNVNIYGTAYYGVNNNIYSCDDFEIVSSAYGNDAIGNFPGKDPYGGTYSARVGGVYINRAYGYGTCDAGNVPVTPPNPPYRNYGYHWDNVSDPFYYSCNGEYIENSFAVTAANCLIAYDYAVVLNDGGHSNGEQPYFHVYVTNNAGTILSSCTEYYVQAPAGLPPAGFTLSGTNINGPVYYLPWTSNSINLTPYIGQTVTAKFEAAGCTQGGHFGYGYFAATCGPAQIISSNGSPCQGSTAVLTAPSVAGGTYSWSGPGIVGPNNGQSVTVNAAGTYVVTVTPSQGAGCAYTLSIVQNFYPNPTANISSQTNVNCNGGNNGSATVTAGSGNPAYTYAWSPSGGNSQTANNLSAGTYNVTVTDSKGCTAITSVTITQPTVLNASLSSQTNVSCNGGNNGSATVNPSGGTPNYTYSWSPSGGNGQTGNNLSAGTYNCTVTDSKGCTKVVSVTITQPAAMNVGTSSTQAGCTTANGSATANPSGGNPAYTYSWSPSGQNTQTATGLSAGTYVVTVTDSKGCTKTASVIVNATNAPTVSSTSSTPAGCSVSNGTATANATGGNPAYTYLWSPSAQNTQTATGLAGGTYNVTITDANGCSVTASVNVASTSAPSASVSSTQATCSQSNGSATANPSGGTPAYTYNWTGGQGTQTATGFSPGNYSVTITDANGCSTTATVSISAANGPTVTASAATVSCNGGNNGSATANVSGGNPAYTYSWNNGQTTQTATGLSAGNYIVTVTDANGCSSVTNASVSQPSAVSVVTTQTNISCSGGNTGSATANSSGGTPGYSYNWSDGQITQTATGLAAGTYSVLVTDANGCTSSASASITQTPALSVAPSQLNVKCNGGNTGSATANVSGGNPAYTYSWSNGQSNQTATGLAAGSYTVVIIDSKGCTTDTSFTISEPTALTNTVSQTNLVCNGGNTGSATATPSGGTPNYSYNWSPTGGNSATANNLAAGNYVVTVTDANGCTATSSVTLTQPAAMTSTVTQTNILCNGGNNGSATVTPSGGNPAYTYTWSPSGGNAATANNLSAGNYNVLVTDANGCTATVAVNITQPNPLTAPLTSTNPKCNGGTNGTATVNPAGGTSPYTYSWNTSPAQNTQTANNLSAGSYNVLVTDANGCTQQTSANITQPAPIVVTLTGNDSTCSGDSVLLSASASGGNPAYTFVWMPGPKGGQNIYVTPTSSTTYSVTASDANGCTSVSVQTFVVNIFPSPKAMFDTVSAGNYSSVYQFNDSSSNASSWYWLFGDGTTSTQQNPVHNYSAAGTYTVTEIVRNQFGCPDTFRRVVTFNDGILIPNVFTPDGDGHNDVWYIPNTGVKGFHVEIYNRWGEKVFETTADEIRWDGRSNSGQLLNDGTYYFALTAYLRSVTGDKNYSTNGYVTLITHRPQ